MSHLSCPETAEVCRAYLPDLIRYLAVRFPWVDPHLCEEAAGTTLIDYVKAPERFDPSRGGLGRYLEMSAWRDLCNLLEREKRQRPRHVLRFSVEIALEDGNLFRKGEGPLDRLVHEEESAQREELLRSIEAECDEVERRVLRLMLAGETETAVFAEALGVDDRPAEEQARAVKRVKDRIKKRIERRRSA
jgi:hypothetical protein